MPHQFGRLYGVAYCHIGGETMAEEARRGNGVGKVEVVIEVNEVLCQTFYAVQVVLYRIGTESRQILFRHKIRMRHHMQFLAVGILPFRQLPSGNEMHFVYPWCELLHAAEPIA